MSDYSNIEPLRALAEKFCRLPGIGRKTALRLAFSVINFTDEEAGSFAQAILDAKRNIRLCPVCQNLTDAELCPVCADERRDRSTICVLEDPRAVLAFEKIKEYRGLYHVLHGVISPIAGVTADKLKLRELMSRLGGEELREIIVATNPTAEGEATAMYIAKLVKPTGIAVSRLAYGVPVGGDLEYADEVTLYRAIEGRRQM